MAKGKNSLAAVTEQIEKLNQNAGLAKIHEKKIEQLTQRRNQIAAKASGLSEREAGRRFKHDQEVKKLQEKIAAAQEAGGDDAPEARKNQKILDKMKRREDIRRSLNLQNAVGGLGDKFKEGFSSLGEKAKSGAGLLLKGAGVVALFAFLQSDTFKSVVKGIVDFVFDVIDLFTGEKSGLDFIKDNFGILLAAVTAFAIKIMGIGPFLSTIATPAIALLKLALSGLFGLKGVIMKTIIPKLKLMGTGLLVKGKAMMIAMAAGFKGMLVGLGAILTPLLPVIAVVALIAAAAYSIVRIFQGFQESFSEANEQFGLFGGILAGFTQGIKNILLDVANVIDSILGFFGFPDAMDGIIKAIEDFDVMEFVGNVMGFFSDLGDSIAEAFATIGRFLKGLGLGAVAAFKALAPGGESPTEAFMRVFNETLAGGAANIGDTPTNANALTQQNMMQNRVAGVQNLGTDLGALQAQQSELERSKIAANIVNNSNIVQKGGDVYNERIETVSISDPNQSPFAQLV